MGDSIFKTTLGIVGLLSFWKAFGVGLNAENYNPSLDNRSAIMGETPHTVPEKNLLWAYTLSYALHPVEFGDGKKNRLQVLDHLLVNHMGLTFGMNSWLDLGMSLPWAFYSAVNDQNWISSVGTSSRHFFFLGDARIRGKVKLLGDKDTEGFHLGFWGSLSVPTGNTTAMMSDNTTKMMAELPMHFVTGPFELFLNPGVSFWGASDRVTSQEQTVLLSKEKSLLLSVGSRLWLIPRSLSTGEGLQFEGGVRGDFKDFKPSLGNTASPVEWMVGAALFTNQNLSFHGGGGGNLGAGTTGPLTRIAAGVRYLQSIQDPPPPPAAVTVGQSSSAYTENDLDRIFEDAQKEPQPPTMAEEETMLRLLVGTEVIDIGTIQFNFNRADLTPKAKQTVALLYEHLQRLNPKTVKIDGHTDSVGKFPYNLVLSKRRAESVKAELIRLGQNGPSITTEGFSFKFPIASNATKGGRAQNRRIEVALDGKSFRKTTYTKEETQMFRRWIYPNGKQPTSHTELSE